MNPAVMYLIKYYNAFTEFPPAALSDFAGNTYGYDLLGTEIEGGINGSRKPVFAAIYLEDQIRSGELIFNLGLRYDYLKSNTYTVRGFQNIGVDINTGLIADSEWHIKDAVQQISPRISLTWLSEPDIQYYLNYGHFVQLPRFNQYYYNAYQYARQAVRGGYYYYQPIGFALDPIYTKMTELGINLGISKIGSVHLAGFYKSTKGLTRIKTVKPPPGADWITYWMVDNGDRSIVKGVEIGLDLTRLKRLSARIMYSLSSAEGTGSNEISYYNAVYYGSTSPKIDSPLDFNRTHSGSVMLDYRFDPGEGGIFASSGINLVARFSSGHPYTYSSFSCG